MGLPLFKILCRWAPKDASFWNIRRRLRIGHSKSSKVVEFDTNQKGVCDFQLVIIIWSYLAPFLRYGDVLAENCEFFLPHSHLMPSLWVNPFESLDELFIQKTTPCFIKNCTLCYFVISFLLQRQIS